MSYSSPRAAHEGHTIFPDYEGGEHSLWPEAELPAWRHLSSR